MTIHRIPPIDPRSMARACRKIAADLRREHAMGLGPIALTSTGSQAWLPERLITRAEAAESITRQAERWEREIATGEPNEFDRRKLDGGGSRAS